jgi:hypothetical protein
VTDVQLITRDDLTDVHGAADAGPTAVVKVNAGPLEGRTFTLRSTELLPDSHGGATTLARGGGIHVDASDPDEKRIDWRGAFKTYDMGEAVDSLVTYINELAERAAVEDSLWGVMSELTDALSGFQDALNENSRRDWREEWARAQDAFAAVRLQVAEFGEAR